VPVLPLTLTTFATLVKLEMFAATWLCDADAADTSTAVKTTVPVLPLTLEMLPPEAAADIVIDDPDADTVTLPPATIVALPVTPLTLTTFATLVMSVISAVTWLWTADAADTPTDVSDTPPVCPLTLTTLATLVRSVMPAAT
jgi:hypothetical protein